MTNVYPDHLFLGYYRIGAGIKGDVVTSVDTFQYRAVWMVLLAKPGSTICELASIFNLPKGTIESRLMSCARYGFLVSEGDNDDLYALRDGDLRYVSR